MLRALVLYSWLTAGLGSCAAACLHTTQCYTAMLDCMLGSHTHDHEDLGAMSCLLKTPACTASRISSRCSLLQALWVTGSTWHQPAHELL